MKRLLFLLLAALTAVFAVLVASDVINFDTDRVDRWTMIFAFGGMAFFLALASTDSSSTNTDADLTTPGPRTTRPVPKSVATGAPPPSRPLGPAQRAPSPADLDDGPLPKRIGSLFAEPGESTPAKASDPTPPPPTPSPVDLVALDTQPPTEAEPDIPEVSDDEQIDEITALVEQAVHDDQDVVASDDADAPIAHDRTEMSPGAELDLNDSELPVEVAADDGQPLARLELRLADYDDEALRRVVKESEALVIAEMVRTGQLTSSGELTERDIASMVFLSYTSEEMLDELRLRKALDTEGDQPGEVALTDRALAPLKNME